MDRVNGKNYERRVMRYLAERDKQIVFDLDVAVEDSSGRYTRQVDVWLPRTREIVECKNRSRPVSIPVIDSLVGAVSDLGAEGGRVFSSAGFTEVALMRAAKASIECVTLPAAESVDEYLPTRTGEGCYTGDYVDLCHSATDGCDMFGRVNYVDDDHLTPICVGRSVDWHNPKMHGFIAYVMLHHQLGRSPSDHAVKSFVGEFGERFTEGAEWVIDEREVSRFAIPEGCA